MQGFGGIWPWVAVTHPLFVALGQGHERSPSQHETIQRLKVRGLPSQTGGGQRDSCREMRIREGDYIST